VKYQTIFDNLMSVIFSGEKKQLKVNFTSEIKKIICFKDFKLFLYFKSGHYQIWDLSKDELLISKTIENDIIKFSILNNTSIVYIRLDGTLKALNVFMNNEPDLFSATIPTTLGGHQNLLNLNIDIFKHNIITQCILYSNQENSLTYLVERATYSSIKIHHVVSVFHLTSSWQPLYQFPIEHEFPLQFSYFNKSNTFALWDQFFLESAKSMPTSKKKNKSSFFYLGEFKNDHLDITRIDILNNPNTEVTSNSIIIGLAETDMPSRILIFENTTTKPIVKVFDIVEKLILKQISCETGPDSYCITNICIVSPMLQNKILSLFEIESYQTSLRLCIFNQDDKNITTKWMIPRTEDSLFEVDRNNGKYCIELEKSLFFEESPFRDMKVNIKFLRAIKQKKVILYFLHKLNIYHVYINKMVVDFLPD